MMLFFDWRLGLIGRNGRGKTTLLRLLMGELPHEGSRDIAITAVNTGAFTMPFTGSTGFTAVPLGLALVLFALCTAAFLGRKRKTEGEL